MIQDQLRDTLDAIRVKLQAELDSQITALGEQQTQAIKQARAAAEQDADRKWAARLETAQGEWTARHQSELAAAAAEANRRLSEESARLQGEAEQAVARIRTEVDGERTRREEVEAEFLQWRDRADVAEQRRVAEAAERQRRETEREQHYRRELAELLGERQRRDASFEAECQRRDAIIEDERKQHQEREAASENERKQLEAAFEEERQKQEAAFKEERESREAVFSEERREHEARETDARQRLEALQTELKSITAKEAESRQRLSELESELQRRVEAEQQRESRNAAEQAEQQQRDAATLDEHRRIVSDLGTKLSVSQERHAAERTRAEGLAAERTALGEELNTVKTSLEALQQAEGQRVRELDQLRSQRHSHEMALEAERKRTSDLTDALGRAQVSLAAERQSMAAAQKALATERLAMASEHEAVARARDAFAAEREAAARTAPLMGQEQLMTVDVTAARVAERQSQLVTLERLLNSTQAITLARSLSEALAALLAGAGAAAPRTALFVINANTLQGWKSSGFAEGSQLPAAVTIEESGALGQAVTTRQTVSATAESAPSFASLPADRAGVAVPILVGGRPVAVLYADDGASDESQAPSSWPEEVQILGQHASVCLAHLTAVRSAQAARIERANASAAATFVPDSTPGVPTEDSGARRYAKLLVSEIKLYNESAVRLGREKRDLMNRLRPEIDRARKLYEERVSPTVAGRGSYFQQELVQTLADGDPTLLGSSAGPAG